MVSVTDTVTEPVRQSATEHDRDSACTSGDV
jgi:hypothetical protein